MRNASGVLPENGWPRDLLVPTGTGMIGPEVYDLAIEYGFSRQALKSPQGVLAAVTLRSRSEIFLEVRIFRGSYQHSDSEEYDCLDRSRPCYKDTDRTYLEADDDGTLRTVSWSSRCGCVKERTIAYSSACPADHGANMQCTHLRTAKKGLFLRRVLNQGSGCATHISQISKRDRKPFREIGGGYL
ncbi:hypothetical protein HPB51_006118 [Rhipicephalus microplus]|uniref:Uncharacterized protein n=1 Tax=Rhipicephalus microplus TaxID=6941 RepID=A0A9J6ER27_RHIMP|nr:hypothetical protein HPB51_006118 [Rhipicephalus microplus]